MPSRVHWMYTSSVGAISFDVTAQNNYASYLTRKAATTLGGPDYTRFTRAIDNIPRGFRKSIPMMLRLTEQFDLSEIMSRAGVKMTRFRLPKHLRKTKNPMYVLRPRAA